MFWNSTSRALGPVTRKHLESTEKGRGVAINTGKRGTLNQRMSWIWVKKLKKKTEQELMPHALI